MFPSTSSRETSGLSGKQDYLFPTGPDIKCTMLNSFKRSLIIKSGGRIRLLVALGNNRVQLKISQTSAIMAVMSVISHKTLFHSLSTYGVNLDEFMFLGVQHRIQKTIFRSRCVLYI